MATVRSRANAQKPMLIHNVGETSLPYQRDPTQEQSQMVGAKLERAVNHATATQSIGWALPIARSTRFPRDSPVNDGPSLGIG